MPIRPKNERLAAVFHFADTNIERHFYFIPLAELTAYANAIRIVRTEECNHFAVTTAMLQYALYLTTVAITNSHCQLVSDPSVFQLTKNAANFVSSFLNGIDGRVFFVAAAPVAAAAAIAA